jgi:hypothetical protein
MRQEWENILSTKRQFLAAERFKGNRAQGADRWFWMEARMQKFQSRHRPKISGAQRVRFLLLSDSKETEPKQPIGGSGWKRECKNSEAVIDKTSTLQALPLFKDRAAVPGSLIGADLKMSELRKLAKPTPRVVSPIQETVDANLEPPSQAARTAAAAAPPSQVDANVTAGGTVIPPSCWDSHQARKLFQPRPEESVKACLQRRVEVLNAVFNNWSNPDQVVEGHEETVSRLAESQKQNPMHKCACLRTAEQTERFARFNEDANTKSQMRQMPVHRSKNR